MLFTLLILFAAFTQYGCVSGHINNQRKCQLGDYGEETKQRL